MVKFVFRTGPHSDLIFNSYNFGYNFNLRFFPLIWLYHKQVTGENIFKEKILRVGNGICLDSSSDSQLIVSLENAKEFGRTLPVDRENFNDNLPIELRGFGFARALYTWSLGSDNLLHLSAKIKRPEDRVTQVLALSSETDIPFLRDYFQFLKDTPKMGACYGWSCTIAKQLKEIQ
ncbi:MAG: hypothetical protein AABX66_03525 [Nanoarchaeota archaeon]